VAPFSGFMSSSTLPRISTYLSPSCEKPEKAEQKKAMLKITIVFFILF
jgi:hypothetical protein